MLTPRPAIMTSPVPCSRPGLPWRLASMAIMTAAGAVARSFLYCFNTVEITGLNNLLSTLDSRKSKPRERGLLTACNHISVVDDPLMWGMLPLRYAMDIENIRWGLGAHDICFKNSFASTFFSLGQVLPTHRLRHSPHGGLYQPTITQAINLLSSPPHASIFTDMCYSTNGSDSFSAPAAYISNRHAWVHVFPEACCHQSSNSGLRYFKWGISRLILESEPAPEFIPMFIHGMQDIMPEDRAFPKFLPRINKKVKIVIGQSTDVDGVFGDYREAWKRLVEEKGGADLLRDDKEAVQLRISVAKAVRDEILRLRNTLGLPAEQDGTASLAETWAKEPQQRKFKSPVDGSLVNTH